MSTEQNAPPQLSPEQWAGLARLGDLVSSSESFLDSPAGAVAVGIALRLGNWNERYQLDASLEELLATVGALRNAGVLRWVRENAAFLRDNIALLQDLLPQILQVLQEIPWAVLPQTMQLLGILLPRLQALEDLIQGPVGADLVAQIKKLGDLWEETRADESLVAALRLLRQLEEDGNLRRLANLSRQIGLMAETIPLDPLLGQLIQETEKGSLVTSMSLLLHSSKALAHALAEADEHQARSKVGGLAGLYRMLKDPDVQRGMRVIAALPVYLQKAGVLPTQPST